MADLKERFSLADEIVSRDLWREARRRAAAPEHLPIRGPEALGVSRWGRLGTGVVAFAVFVAAALFAWEAFHGDVRPRPGPRIETPSVDLATNLGPGWSELPAPPEVRTKAATAWTGSQLVIWGGYVFDGGGDKTPTDDGFMFNGVSRTWGPMPAGPLSARSDAASAWSGSELLIWGGFTGDCCVPSEMFLDDGAAYDPATGRWKTLPASPLSERAPFSVWTGRELIVWGSRDRTVRHLDGAAYDPDANTWRPIADGPIELTDGSAVWTGEEMIVFGAALDGNNHAGTETNIGAAYNPTTDTWRRIQDSTLSPQAVTATWPGSGEMIAWDYEQATAAYDPRSDTWRDLPQVPLQFAECHPRSVAIPGHVFGDFCGGLVTFSVAEDRWEKIRRDEIWGWVTEPVAAGSAVLVLAHSLKLSDVPGRTFDTKMLGYVPRTGEASGGRSADPFVPEGTTAGADTRLPLVWPDGTTAVLVLPSDLLDGVGVHPSVSYLLTAYRPSRFSVVFLHGPVGVEQEQVLGTEPLRVVQDAAGADVELWDVTPSPHVDERGERLVFRTRSWSVVVSVARALTAGEVAASMSVEERSGYPIVHTEGSIALSDEFGEGDGPLISLSWRGFPDRFVEIALEGCAGFPDEVGSEYGATCLADDAVFLDVYGSRSFVTAVIERARVEDFAAA